MHPVTVIEANPIFTVILVSSGVFFVYQWLNYGIDLVQNPGIIEGVDSKTLAIMFAAVRDNGMSVTLLTHYAGSIMSNAAMLEVGEYNICV